MAKKERRERKRGVRREGRHEAEARQHQRGGDWNPFNLPDGVVLFKPEKGKTYNIDILPYIAGEYNKACKPGDEMYVLTYPVYRSLGIEERSYIAIHALTGAKDPIHEHFLKLRKAGAVWDDMKAFSEVERQLWLVFVHEQSEKGIQIYDASYKTFGELLKKEIADAGEEVWVDNFDDPAGGATIKTRFTGEQVGSNTWVKADKITFIEREDGFTADGDRKLADKILDQLEGICLDDLLKIPTYEILKASLVGEPVVDAEDDDEPAPKAKKKAKAPADEEEEDEPPVKKKAKPKPPPEEDDDEEEEEEEPAPKAKKKARKQATAEDLGIEKGGTVEHDEHGTCTVIRVAPDGLTVSIRDDDGDIHRDIDPSDLEPVVEKPKAKAKVKPAPEPDDEDDEDEDDDIPFDPPAKAKAKAKAKPAPDEDDEDDEPAPKAKAKAKAKAKPVDDEDEDDDEAPAKPKKAGTKKTGKDKDWDEDWSDD